MTSSKAISAVLWLPFLSSDADCLKKENHSDSSTPEAAV